MLVSSPSQAKTCKGKCCAHVTLFSFLPLYVCVIAEITQCCSEEGGRADRPLGLAAGPAAGCAGSGVRGGAGPGAGGLLLHLRRQLVMPPSGGAQCRLRP